MIEHKDYTGGTIQIGDRVAVSCHRDSNYLEVGEVIKILPKSIKIVVFDTATLSPSCDDFEMLVINPSDRVIIL